MNKKRRQNASFSTSPSCWVGAHEKATDSGCCDKGVPPPQMSPPILQPFDTRFACRLDGSQRVGVWVKKLPLDVSSRSLAFQLRLPSCNNPEQQNSHPVCRCRVVAFAVVSSKRFCSTETRGHTNNHLTSQMLSQRCLGPQQSPRCSGCKVCPLTHQTPH